MAKPKKTSPLTDEALVMFSPEELQAELRYLRPESAYIKKLKVLAQRDKSIIKQ